LAKKQCLFLAAVAVQWKQTRQTIAIMSPFHAIENSFLLPVAAKGVEGRESKLPTRCGALLSARLAEDLAEEFN
jgi:hypothetical protein